MQPLKPNIAKARKPSTVDVVRRVLAEHGRPHARDYMIIMVFMAIVAGCTSLSAWIMKDLVNAAFVNEATTSILYFPLLVSGLFILKGIFSYFQEVGVARIGARIVGDVQRQLYDHLLRMDIAFFHRRSSGDLITRMSNGATAVRDAINLVAVTLGRDLLTVLGLCTVMLIQDPVLFAIVLTTAPVAYLMLRRLSALAKKAAQTEAGGMATIVSLTRETSQGIRMLKSFQLEDLLKGRMEEATKAVEEQRNRLARVKAAVAPLSEVLSGLAIGAVILYASWRSRSDPASIGSFFSFITALLLAGEPLRRLSRLHVDLATAAERINMLYHILDQKPVEVTQLADPQLVTGNGQIVFENVSFEYPGHKAVLRDVNLTFPGGKVTALVGASGGGKTTILGLMQGFFRPTSGTISIGGTSIDTVSLGSLRQNIAYLDQEAFLFEGTVEDNIVGSCRDRDHARVVAAAQFAGADGFIRAMKDGYETQLRELATNLSGGQKQRMAIARAFYKNAPILLLDEPTSALDSTTEEHIRRAILSLAEGKTTVIVAHRLSTVQRADLIYVIEQGVVVEAGTHHELMARQAHYAALFRGQSVVDGSRIVDDATAASPVT